MERKSQEWRQYLIACIGGISFLLNGFSLGWTSPIIIKLRNLHDSPLSRLITVDEESWIGSLLTIGAMFGPFLGGIMVGRVGRPWALSVSCLPLLLCWSLLVASSNLAMIYAARVLGGLFVGMTFTVTPLYLGEIATNAHRGAVCACLSLFLNTGFLLVYSIGPYLSYAAVAWVGVAQSLFFLAVTFVAPESPYYYLANDDTESAGQCLMKIRGKTRDDVQAELEKMDIEVKDTMKNSARFIDVFRGTNLTAISLCCGLMMVQQFCGINAVLFYLTNIFEAAGTNLDSAISTIIIGAIQVLVSPITPLVIDRIGRRILLLVACGGSAIALGFLGMFYYLDEIGNPAVEKISFLPVVCLVVFVSMYSWGMGPVPLGYAAEMMPLEVKATAMPMILSFCWILSFIVTRFFGPVSQAVGMGPSFWIFCGFCLLSLIFVWFLVPETKGKSFQEIQNMLKKS